MIYLAESVSTGKNELVLWWAARVRDGRTSRGQSVGPKGKCPHGDAKVRPSKFMARLLVVEDGLSQAHLIKTLLEIAGHDVRTAADGIEGLEVAASFTPQLVVTDLQMPRMDGLELVEVMRRRHPATPVVLMTAFGNEDVAVEALKRGAASYVPKLRLSRDLLQTVSDLLAIAHADRSDRVLPCLAQCEAMFVLDNDASVIPELIGYVQGLLSQVHQWGENTLMRLGVALHEAVVNAMHHGNLEIGSEHREGAGSHYEQLVNERRSSPPFAGRSVSVCARVSRFEAVMSVRDEGPGFDPHGVPDPTTPANLGKVSGRGLFLIRTFLDEVRYNSRGNEITMIKRRELDAALAT